MPSRFPKQGMINKILDKTIRVLKSPLPRVLGKERFSETENSIPSRVNKVVHCVAIDETRNAFLPTLMPLNENIEEVWFPGVHADVGGGYADNLLDIGPYEFMKKRLAESATLPEKDLFKSCERNIDKSQFCFHFHGLNTSTMRIKNLFGFGTAMRRIRVLKTKDRENAEEIKPKIHASLYRVMTRESVFAANSKEKRTWTINYDPYNVRELKDEFEIVND